MALEFLGNLENIKAVKQAKLEIAGTTSLSEV